MAIQRHLSKFIKGELKTLHHFGPYADLNAMKRFTKNLFMIGTVLQLCAIAHIAYSQDDNERAYIEAPDASSATCTNNKIKFSLPVDPETQGRSWTITNTFDLDRNVGTTRDFMGKVQKEARTYDQHLGTDFGLPNFRKMDQGTAVFAAADGTVIATSDGFFDREVKRGKSDSNMVIVRHSNGLRTAYAHLRKNSLKVKKGDLVARGQELGLVGSSGDSSGPHLHFEIIDCQNQKIDPFEQNLFDREVSFQLTPSIMDYAISQERDFSKEPADKQIEGLKTNSFITEANQENYILLWISEVMKGNEIELDFIDPSQKVAHQIKSVIGDLGKAHPMIGAASATFKFPTEGNWKVMTKVNGKKTGALNFRVKPSTQRSLASETPATVAPAADGAPAAETPPTQ